MPRHAYAFIAIIINTLCKKEIQPKITSAMFLLEVTLLSHNKQGNTNIRVEKYNYICKREQHRKQKRYT